MVSPRFRGESGVTLVGGGPVSQEDLCESLALAPYLVAADGGADLCLAAGVIPDLVIGDLDSVSPEALQTLGTDRIVHDPDQDTTDFEKCLARIESPLVLGLGFLGARIDHQLAAFSALVRRPGGSVVLIGGDDICLHAPPALALDLPAGMRLSLFPLARVSGTSRGLEWPIDGPAFAADGRIGTSNRVTGAVRLSFSGAGMLLILPRAALGAVLQRLGPAHVRARQHTDPPAG